MAFKDFLVKEMEVEVSTGVVEEEKPQPKGGDGGKEGIFLNVAQVGFLNGLFGLPVKSAEDLLDKVRRTQTVRFLGKSAQEEGLEVVLEPEDLWAIKQQAIGMGRPFREYGKEFIEDAISKELHGCVKAR